MSDGHALAPDTTATSFDDDAERLRRFEARQQTIKRPRLATITPNEVAQLYASGDALSDAELRSLAHDNPRAWAAAVDPTEREFILKGGHAQQRTHQAPATPHEGAQLSAGLAKIEALLMAPVVPVKDAEGKIVGARRAVPEVPEPASLKVAPQPTVEPLGALAAGTTPTVDQPITERVLVPILDKLNELFHRQRVTIEALELRVRALEGAGLPSGDAAPGATPSPTTSEDHRG